MTHIYSIDTFYARINDHVSLAQSYTEIKELSFIIQSCRLKPYDYVFGKRNKKRALYKWWFDEFGNSLKIAGDTLDITYNDLSLDRSKIVCTDLYHGLPIDKVVKMSKMLHVHWGKDPDTYQDCGILTLLGLDNYLRSYLYLCEEWIKVSPLLLGIENLKRMANNLDIKYFKELKDEEEIYIPCEKAATWLSFLPCSAIFSNIMKKENEMVYHLINQGEHN